MNNLFLNISINRLFFKLTYIFKKMILTLLQIPNIAEIVVPHKKYTIN